MFQLLQIAPVDVNQPINKIFEYSVSLGILACVVALFVWLLVRQDKQHQEQLLAKDQVITKLQDQLLNTTTNNITIHQGLQQSIKDISTYVNVISGSVDKNFTDLKQFLTILDSFKSK